MPPTSTIWLRQMLGAPSLLTALALLLLYCPTVPPPLLAGRESIFYLGELILSKVHASAVHRDITLDVAEAEKGKGGFPLRIFVPRR